MFRSSLTLVCLAVLAVFSPLSYAEDDYLEKGQFCIREKAGIDRNASAGATAIFASLHACGHFCSDASYLKNTAPAHQIDDLVSRCETAFSELPEEIQSRFDAPSDPEALAATAETRNKAEECRALAIKYPRLANDRRNPSFNKCAISCENAANQIEAAGYDIGGYGADCDQQYTGARARIR